MPDLREQLSELEHKHLPCASFDEAQRRRSDAMVSRNCSSSADYQHLAVRNSYL